MAADESANNASTPETPLSAHQPPPEPPVDPAITVAQIGAKSANLTGWITAGATILVAGIGGVFASSGGNDGKTDDAKPSASVTTHTDAAANPTPATSPSASTSPSQSSSTEADSSVPAKAFPGEPLPLRLNGESTCDFASHVDFDSVPFVTRVDTLAPDAENVGAPADLAFFGCKPAKLRISQGSRAGVLLWIKPFSKAACEEAANGGSFEGVTLQRTDSKIAGLVKGSSICVKTDKGRIVRAELVDAPRAGAQNLVLKVTTVS
ncbi:MULTISPECIES: hypothetical protein [unclassified Streptomyces]|uniref:hypothetical protein n=1 Tax=unclassified Streptomyces TaxID=2593676 RepID=UPI0036F16DFD